MLNMDHFESLRGLINRHLEELVKRKRIASEQAQRQIEEFPWLYGALGKVPADACFICENPSLTGVRKANVDTIDGELPDIEAQWWGGTTDNAARRFRVALYQLGLKTTQPRERGGWECYITNVIKQANIAKDQAILSLDEKKKQAKDWADVLQWELDQVKPKYVFCVGGNSSGLVRFLQRDLSLEKFPVYEVMHYSARAKDTMIIDNIVAGVRSVLNSA